MSNNQAFVLGLIIMGVILVIFFSSIIYLNGRAKKKVGSRQEEERARDELRQITDFQSNTGGHIANWLEEKLNEFLGNHKEFGLRVERIPHNGGYYSIHIKLDLQTPPALNLVQINLDFVRKHNKNCEVHVHYGAIGPDFYFPILPHNPRFGLTELIAEKVIREVSRFREIPVAV